MKELSIEEKAKRYDEALEKGKQIQNTPYTAHWDIMKEVAEYLLPGLRESEDERIRKEIIAHIKWCEDSGYCAKEEMTRWITFLEKQGEQKSYAWSEEDRRMLIGLIDELDAIMNKATPHEISVYSKYANWLNSIKDRVGCKVNCTTTKEWKPSDEQIEALESATVNCAYSEYQDCLRELIEQLKQLRGE